MANVFIEEQYMSDIANAIRNRTGKTDSIYPENMSEEILSIGADATVAANEMVEGATAYVDGEVITGEIPLWNGISWSSTNASWDSTNSRLKLSGSINARRFLESNTSGTMYCAGSNLGDALPEDVASGKTFTSASGLKVSGELQEGAPTSYFGLSRDDTTLSEGNVPIDDMLVLPYIEMTGIAENDVLCRAGTSYSLRTMPVNFGDALQEHVASGVTFTSSSGLKVTGTGSLQMNTWKKYNVIDQTQSAAYKLQEVNGSMRLFLTDGATLYKTMSFDSSTGNFTLGGGNTGVLHGQELIDNYSEYPYCYYNNDTDTSSVLNIHSITKGTNNIVQSYTATGTKSYSIKNEPYAKGTYIEDVQSTSVDTYPSDGYKDGYWYVLQSGNSGISVKTGTTTSKTINTGLSSISYFMIFRKSITSTGMVQATYDENQTSSYGATIYHTACTSYSNSSATVSMATALASNTINGGTITWPGSGNYAMATGVTYYWVAIGTE